MLLAIDIGNSNTVIGVFQGKKLSSFFRISSQANKTPDEVFLTLKNLLSEKLLKNIKAGIICSVVPPLTTVYLEMLQKYLRIKPVTVDSNLPLGIKILYTDPAQVGADRLANAVAAWKLYGGPTIVVDLGTATTFDVISAKGEYVGGAICPGIETSAVDLFRRAAQLFKVKLDKPKKVIGKTTEESLRSGIIFGTASQIDGMVEKIEKELGKKCKVIATGGLAPLVFGLSKKIQKMNLSLTLEGLRLIYEKCVTPRFTRGVRPM